MLAKYGYKTCTSSQLALWYKGLGGGPTIRSAQIDIFNWWLGTRQIRSRQRRLTTSRITTGMTTPWSYMSIPAQVLRARSTRCRQHQRWVVTLKCLWETTAPSKCQKIRRSRIYREARADAVHGTTWHRGLCACDSDIRRRHESNVREPRTCTIRDSVFFNKPASAASGEFFQRIRERQLNCLAMRLHDEYVIHKATMRGREKKLLITSEEVESLRL